MKPAVFQHRGEFARRYYAELTSQKSGHALSVSPPRKPSFLGSLIGMVLFFVVVVEAGALFR